MDRLSPIVFSLERAKPASSDLRIRPGKVFEVGDYPDMLFSITEDEMDSKLASFSSVPNDIEHLKQKYGIETILDGHLGETTNLRRVGKDVIGDVAIPAWLDDLMGDDPLSVSLAFDKDKNIIGNALVIEGRIADAKVLQAAFSAAQKPPRTEKSMKFIDALRDLLGRTNDAGEIEGQPAAPPAQASFSKAADDAKVKALEAESVAHKAQIDGIASGLIRSNAYAFHLDMVRAGKAVPAEKDAMVALFVANGLADLANTGAMFSATGEVAEGPLLKAVKASYEARAAIPVVASTGTVFSAGGTRTNEMTKERRAELMGYTPVGQAILQEGK